MCDKEGGVLSAEGVKSEEYRVWKAQTLAKQTSHKEGPAEDRVVAAVRGGGGWSCPKYGGEQLDKIADNIH